ncbi:hypothetical protein BC567DRAFT_235693 [Phyllosticta citribraziliensis]
MEFFDSGLLAGPWLGRLASFGDVFSLPLGCSTCSPFSFVFLGELGRQNGSVLSLASARFLFLPASASLALSMLVSTRVS